MYRLYRELPMKRLIGFRLEEGAGRTASACEPPSYVYKLDRRYENEERYSANIVNKAGNPMFILLGNGCSYLNRGHEWKKVWSNL
jgi:hypothetical protein